MAEPTDGQKSCSGQRTVVVAIDESEHAEHAFDFYVQNVKKPGDSVVLVTVPEHQSIFNSCE
ncbi:hypothetical protein KP79_PYT16196 [Mizuhopecten yessoensis]|uniref:UspA domain-containing protein n=1 Tax=Mizuhopecten yessoensis TaxID=6573 RepID=A0A210QIY7_MIZYE|nr:hypothetical protein KP79_PYT16196 [Mizuhopecten yessoensis]